jgi:hypothetical protein
MTLDYSKFAKKTTLIESKIPGTKRVDHNRAVKMYERGAGDRILPSDLRPPHVLKVSSTWLIGRLHAQRLLHSEP